jgi:predicted transcriptional regulator
MTIREIQKILDAEVCCGEELLDREVHTACGSDLMSDVLAFVKDQAVLLTGLCNPQAIRTAEMMDIVCLVFVRSKVPTDMMIELARENDLVILSTKLAMFPSCGLLYENGLRGGSRI